jgi:hypothetical protein
VANEAIASSYHSYHDCAIGIGDHLYGIVFHKLEWKSQSDGAHSFVVLLLGPLGHLPVSVDSGLACALLCSMLLVATAAALARYSDGRSPHNKLFQHIHQDVEC